MNATVRIHASCRCCCCCAGDAEYYTSVEPGKYWQVDTFVVSRGGRRAGPQVFCPLAERLTHTWQACLPCWLGASRCPVARSGPAAAMQH
jgi:hypothetical protein